MALTIPHTFAPSTMIESAKMNANFDAVVSWGATVSLKDGSVAYTGLVSGPATDPTSDNHLARKAYVDRGRGVVSQITKTTEGSWVEESIIDAGIVLPEFDMPELDENLSLLLSLHVPLVELEPISESPDYGQGAHEWWITTDSNTIIAKVAADIGGSFGVDQFQGFSIQRWYFDNSTFAEGAAVNLKIRGRIEGGGRVRAVGTTVGPIQFVAAIV